MLDSSPYPHVEVETLAGQAFLYLANELEEEQRLAFEQRLEFDSSAQNALTQAVQLFGLINADVVTPVANYRSMVRKAVLPGPSIWKRYRSRLVHVTALAACMCLCLALGQPVGSSSAHLAFSSASEVEETSIPVARSALLLSTQCINSLQESMASSEDEEPDPPEVWSELSNFDHLQRTHEDEMRRRERRSDALLSSPFGASRDRINPSPHNED